MALCRAFTCQQGLQTHVHMVHELHAAQLGDKNGHLRCSVCGLRFRSAQLLEQHDRRAHRRPLQPPSATGQAHASAAQMLPSDRWQPPQLHHDHRSENGIRHNCTALQSSSAAEHCNQQETCEVCGCVFGSAQDLQEHLQWLVPDKAAEQQLACPYCSKLFGSQRALAQHATMSKCADAAYKD